MATNDDRRRSLLMFAFISHSLSDQTDLLLGIVPLFRPIADSQAGQAFSPQGFASMVTEKFGLPMHPIVAEEFIPRLLKVGMLTTQGENIRQGTYQYKSSPKTDAEEKGEEKIEAIINKIVSGFEEFTRNFPTLLTLSFSRDDLENILFDWLISSETMVAEGYLSDDTGESQEKIIRKFEGHKYRTEGEYLCARYVADLQHNDPKLFEDLARISAGALASEVVLSLRHPPEVDYKVTDFTVLFDAPFVMDLLRLTGKERAENSRYIFESLVKMGTRVATFEHNCEEIVGNLRGVLKKFEPLRVGPTGDALRKGEVAEVYAREVMTNVDEFVSKEGIRIFEKNVVSPVADIRFFSDEQAQHFGEELREWSNDLARERDVQSITLVMRRRRGHRTNDVFKSKYLFLSHNPTLVRHSRRFCLEESLINDQHVPPAIHERRMAILLWLTLGSAQRLALSRKQLIANCANALRSRPDVIESMRETIASVKPELKSQFDALLTRPRSVQVVMDLTLGVQEVVGPDQAERVFQIIKESAIEEEKSKFEAKLAEAREKFGKKLSAAEIAIERLSDERNNLQDTLDESVVRDRKMMQGWVRTIQRRANSARNFARAVLSAIIIVGGASAAWTIGTPAEHIGAWIAAAVGIVGLLVPIWAVKLEFLRQWSLDWKSKQLRAAAAAAGRDDLLIYVDVNWELDEIEWRGHYETGVNVVSGDKLL